MSTDVVSEFLAELRSRGLEPVGDIVADGQLHRCRWVGDSNGSKNGAYVLHLDGHPAGFAQCFKRDIRFKWSAQGAHPRDAVLKELRTKMEAERARREQEEHEKHEKAALKAQAYLLECKDADPGHEYLARKRIGPHGLKVDTRGRLVVSLRDPIGAIWSLQVITPDGTKRFQTDGRKHGLFHLLGELGDELVITEGFATAASIREATGLPVVIAFDCGNLLPVAKVIRDWQPRARIVIAADDDHSTDGNPGLAKARDTAQLIGAAVAVPTFPEMEERGTDFNDFAMLRGHEPVAEIICGALAKTDDASWPEPEPLFAEHERPEPYPVDALPATIRAAVETFQASGQQPVELVACSALAVASLACQGLANADRDGSLIGPCSLSFLTVAVSGERKTACDKRMRRAIMEWQHEKREEQEPEMRAAERRLAIWQTKHDGALQKIKRLSGSTKPDDQDEVRSLEGLLEVLDGEQPHVPPRISLFYEDVTPEKLATCLTTNWPSASLWSDEAGLVVGSHAMSEGSALRFLALLNRLWDGNDFSRERETRSSAYIHGRRFTVSLMLQPDTLARLTAAGGGIARGVGALARFLIAWPSSTIGSRPYREGDLNAPELLAFDARLRQVLDTTLPLDEKGAIQPPELSLSAEAFTLWRQFHDDVERELVRTGEFSELPDFGAKAAEQAARIACVLHIFEHGSAGTITPEMMIAGARIAAWHLTEARRVFAVMGHAGEASDAQLLLEWLQDQADDPTLRNILRLGPYRLRDRKRRDSAIAKLVEHGLARIDARGDAEHLILNPKMRL
jgi:putative DNA primase/helicase